LKADKDSEEAAMKKVAPLRYGVIFKKAFCDPEIFSAFVRDVTGVPIEVDLVAKTAREKAICSDCCMC
jgi:hypothetical protein